MRDPLHVINGRLEDLFDIVHADLCDPYGQENICSTKYMSTLVEDHSRMIWAYLE